VGSQLIHDLEAVFLDDRIGEHFLGNALELLLRFVAVPAIEIENEEFPLAYAGNLRVTQAGKSVLNGLTLGVQNSAFRHNPDVSFHGASIAIPLRVFTPACWTESAALFAGEAGEMGAAGFVGEKGMFHGGAMEGDEFGFAEAHLRRDFVFAEE